MQTKKRVCKPRGKAFSSLIQGSNDMETYNHNNSTIIEDQAWALHFHTLIQGEGFSAFDSVLKIAKLYAEINDDFKAILEDYVELAYIAANVAERTQNERSSIHGRLAECHSIRMTKSKLEAV